MYLHKFLDTSTKSFFTYSCLTLRHRCYWIFSLLLFCRVFVHFLIKQTMEPS